MTIPDGQSVVKDTVAELIYSENKNHMLSPLQVTEICRTEY